MSDVERKDSRSGGDGENGSPDAGAVGASRASSPRDTGGGDGAAPASRAPKLELRRITRRYGAETVLDDVSLDVPLGDTLVLFGPSGAGKTVLLRTIAGVVEPDAGEVLIDGADQHGVEPEARGIGMAFQNFALFPHLSAHENIASPLHALGETRGERESRVQRVACLLKIDHVLEQAPGALSNGQKQRTSLARALVAEPTLLLLDDPLRNVDAKLRFEMRLELPRLLADRGTTVVYVTQDYREAMALGDRIAVLVEGAGGADRYAGRRLLRARHAADRHAVRGPGHQPARRDARARRRRPVRHAVGQAAEHRSGSRPRRRTRACTLGVRPESIGFAHVDHPHAIPVGVEAETPLNEKVVDLVTTARGREILVSRPAYEPGPASTRAHIVVDAADALLFDRESGRAHRARRWRVGGWYVVRHDEGRGKRRGDIRGDIRGGRRLRRRTASGSRRSRERSDPMTQLELESVTKVYDPRRNAVPAVAALDLLIEPGEIIALLGSSGCGKTSTLRMIAGFEEATSGRVRIAGRDVGRLAPAARRIAMAFEGYSLYPPMTVRENIGFALEAARVDAAEIRRRVDAMAAMLEIGSVLERYPSSISGGQQQRAGLARALIRDADLHLLDEPMGQLEPRLRALLRGRIKHYLKERGHTAILVTHDQTEANALADRIAVMEGGVLQQYATPAALRDRPANLFTGTFIGEPPMNVVGAESYLDEHGVRFRLGDDSVLVYPREAFAVPVLDIIDAHRTLTIGVRPHAVRLRTDGRRDGVALASGRHGVAAVRVIVSQWLGDQSHVATELAGGTLVAVEHERVRVRRGEEVQIALAPDDLHLFAAEDGRALAHGAEVA